MGLLKKILIGIGVFFLLIIVLISIWLYASYQDYKWHTEIAESLGVTPVGAPRFNEKLVTCSPSYAGHSMGDSWEIRGLKNGKCVFYFKESIIDINDTEFPIEINYKLHICELPPKIYTNPIQFSLSRILESKYCESD